jgi:hypothetical protein
MIHPGAWVAESLLVSRRVQDSGESYAAYESCYRAHRGRRFALAGESFIPIQGTIKSILNGVVVIAVVLWLLDAFGLFHGLRRIHIG